MTPPAYTPDRTHRAADYLLPPLAAAGAAALCLFLFAPDEQTPRVAAFVGGWSAGQLLPGLYWSRYRVLGFAAYATTAAAVVALAAGHPDGWRAWLAGVFAGLLGVAAGTVLWHRTRFRAESPRLAVAVGVGAAIVIATAFVAAGPTDPGVRAVYRWLLVALTTWAAVQAWVTLLRPAIEVAAEPLVWLMYRVRTAGPGLAEFPRAGPVLVIANHAAWFDPLYLAKVLPRPVVPVMTARFFHLPVLRPILQHIVRVIVVPEAPIRRQAPEVQKVIEALDAGLVVIIFPEGYLRRKEEQLLRRFGQGVWQVLRDRPAIPVLACWIEGAWGSYASYQGGPPTKNKRFDVRRPIAIGVSAPEAVPAEMLADHLPTRIYLMNKVLEARKHLGLPPVPPVELPKKEEGFTAEGAEEKGE
jgi:1-acyl-sn-glycerol-3-phosphate acyltransferase